MEQQNKLGITVKKSDNFSEWYTQICGETGADLVDIRYDVQGFVVHKPWAFKIIRKIYELLEKEVELDNHEPMLFPTVIPEENLLKEKEHAGFAPDVFWITEAGKEKLERKIALRPTGETAIYPMYNLWIRTHKDLPLKRYQSRITVFRNEKTTRPFLRGREFCFFETHDVFETHAEAMQQIHKDMEIMQKVAFQKLNLPFIFFQRPKWDKFLGADNTFASDSLMPDGRRNQMSSTHDLGHNFAKAYNVQFNDKNGTKQYGYQTCFGPGIYRLMAALIGIHGDDKGLTLPYSVAPIQIVIIPITFANKEQLNEKVIQKCSEVERRLKEFGYIIKLDSSDESPGFKYNKYEMIGIPLRIEIGPKEAESDEVTIALRTRNKKEKINLKHLDKEIKGKIEAYEQDMKKRAEEYFKDNTTQTELLAELKQIIEKHRGFIKVPFCSTDFDGQQCAETLKTETIGGVVSGTKFENPEKVHAGQRCIICNKEAKHIVYVAKSY
ncbi:proline--tRNA ligase [Candidatus Woesearchaeota archaeon]|nr:proline--tRNA ligase [Candidatus Woesearchaeota archaeon]